MNMAMAITVGDAQGGTFTTSPFQLLQWKHALILEQKGMTMSRGKVSTHVRKLFKVKRNTPLVDLLFQIESWLSEITAAHEDD